MRTSDNCLSKMHQIWFRLGLRARPRWGAYSIAHSWTCNPTSKGRGGREEREGAEGREIERREKEGREARGEEKGGRTLVGPHQHFQQIDAYLKTELLTWWLGGSRFTVSCCIAFGIFRFDLMTVNAMMHHKLPQTRHERCFAATSRRCLSLCQHHAIGYKRHDVKWWLTQ